MGKRQKAALETRQKLIDAMRSLLQEKEAETIGIEEITARAGVARDLLHLLQAQGRCCLRHCDGLLQHGKRNRLPFCRWNL